jgi:hypothetical protein
MDHKVIQCESVIWIQMVQYAIQWLPVVNIMVINLQVH